MSSSSSKQQASRRAFAHPASKETSYSEEDIILAFKFFDAEGGKITKKSVKEKLAIFNKKLTKSELNTIFCGQDSITSEEVKNLVNNKEFMLTKDPVEEAFAILDPAESGVIDEDHLKKLCAKIGLGDITDEELKLLTDSADSDGDGRISVEDFRSLSKSKSK